MIGAPLGPSDRLLLRLPNWLGDGVMAEPAVRSLVRHRERTGAPGSITLAGPRALTDLYRARYPDLAAVGPEDPSAWRGHDVALLLTGSFRSAFTAWRAGIPRRVGQARDGRALLLTDRLDPPRAGGGVPTFLRHLPRRRRLVPRPVSRVGLELLWLVGVPVHGPDPTLAPRPEALVAAEERRAALGLAPGAPFVLVAAGPDSAKGLEPGPLATALAPVLADRGLAGLVAAGPGEEALAGDLAEALGGVALVDPVADLEELLAHASAARLFVGADSGPRHLARAVGTPTLILFGATDPRHTPGARPGDRHLFQAPECGPCHRALCPLTGESERQCMRVHGEDEIRRAALELLPS